MAHVGGVLLLTAKLLVQTTGGRIVSLTVMRKVTAGAKPGMSVCESQMKVRPAAGATPDTELGNGLASAPVNCHCEDRIAILVIGSQDIDQRL